MSNENRSVHTMWKQYLASLGEDNDTTTKQYKSWHFCDNEEDANELVELVMKREKRATASLYLSYEYENEDIPKIGDLSVITNYAGEAKCIIKTVNVTLTPYNEVSQEFAAKEGEGDKSLEYWKKAHWSYFSREMDDMGKEPREDMLVVCEEFEVVYQ